MSRNSFRYLHRSRYTELLLTAIVISTATATLIQADERPAKPAATSVAKAGAPQLAGTSTEADKRSKEHIQELIRELGSPHYTVRRAATTELRQVGAEAFDMLDGATDNADPEIAASANYLLRQIPVRWAQPDDPPVIRAAMRNYNQEPESRRLLLVEGLDQLSDGRGLAALCRIARYDRSSLVSRTAAIVVIRPPEKSKDQPHIDSEVVERELGTSSRASARWLRQYLAQQRDPAASVVVWKQLVGEESARLDKNMGDTSKDILLGLTWNLAEVYRQVGDQVALNGALDRMIGLAAEGSDETLVSLLAWMAEYKSWNVLDTFLAKHQARLEQSKRPLYFAALARAAEGKKDLADDLATKAAMISLPEGSPEGLLMAKELEERLQFDWAVREYRHAIEKQPAGTIDKYVVLSQISLATLLHDYEHEKDAAEALEQLTKDVLGEGKLSRLYRAMRESQRGNTELPSPEEIAARYHFYRASQYEQVKDWKRARGELELAINFDPKDADVLIEMYRLPETDAKWRDGVMARVGKLCKQFERDIEENPSDPTPYNQWAWLISNTEGDYQQAIRYSRRSLDLIKRGEGGSASFLDTLGRCYYAAGDYENAVKYEREAIAKNNYLQVMRRQLAQFEKALADKKAGAAKSPAKSNYILDCPGARSTQLKSAQISTGELAYIECGAGPPILLVHGFPLDHTMWDAQIESLSKLARVIAPDLRGFGQSPLGPVDPTYGITMERYADDLVEFLDTLNLGLDQPVVFVGLSMGGYIAWQFARKYAKRLRALVLFDSRSLADTNDARAGRIKMAENVAQWGSGRVAEMLGPKLVAPSAFEKNLGIVKALRRVVESTAPAAIAAAQRGLAARPDMTSFLPQINVPTLVIVGDQDAISPPAEMQAIAAAIVNAEFVVIPNSGHMTTMENPDAVNAALSKFVVGLRR